jgi:uncharacterized protein (UPF0303 family)
MKLLHPPQLCLSNQEPNTPDFAQIQILSGQNPFRFGRPSDDGEMTSADDSSLRADLAILAQQEQLLRFSAFDANTAWQLGSRMRDKLLALASGGSTQPVGTIESGGGTVEIDLAGQILFACATPGATPGQADWIRRKRNTVRRFARSSYAVGRQLALDSHTLESRHGLTLADFAAHGGGFPLWLAGTGPIGAVIVSGLPQRDDHNLVAAALAEQLGIAIPTLP